jgi:photosystem II stability/assembly factor-like uncharacterized protein
VESTAGDLASSGLSGLVVDESMPSNLYLYGARSIFFRSTDGGEHWNASSSGLPDSSSDITSLVRAGSVLILGTNNAGLLKSEDRGETWRSANAGLPIDINAGVHFNSITLSTGRGLPASLFALGTQVIPVGSSSRSSRQAYVSTDQGESWRRLQPFEPAVIGPAVPSMRNATVLFARNPRNSMATTLDGGRRWNLPSSNNGLPTEGRFSNVFADSKLPSTLYSYSFEGSARSMNSGHRWSYIGGGEIIARSKARSGVVFAQGASGVVNRSEDFGDTWTKFYDAGVSNFINGSLSFAHVVDVPGSSRIYIAGNFANGGNLTMPPVYSGPVQRSDDGGAHWANAGAGLPTYQSYVAPYSPPTGAVLTAFAVDESDTDVAYVAALGRLYQTTNAGMSWSAIANGTFPRDIVYALVVNRANANVIYAATEDGLFISLDRGASWSPAS